MKLTNEFQSIRDWAHERQLDTKGDPKTQFAKLVEEAGELAQGVLKNRIEETADAIGDMVVVLTNLSTLCGLKIEDCINAAYTEIASRKGAMVDGTFVKQGNIFENEQENKI